MGRDPEFGAMQRSKKDTRLVLNRLSNDMALRYLQRKCLRNERRGNCQQLLCRGDQLFLWDGAMALLREGLQHVPDACLCTVQRFWGKAEALGERIGGFEPNAINIEGKLVRVLLHAG